MRAHTRVSMQIHTAGVAAGAVAQGLRCGQGGPGLSASSGEQRTARVSPWSPLAVLGALLTLLVGFYAFCRSEDFEVFLKPYT